MHILKKPPDSSRLLTIFFFYIIPNCISFSSNFSRLLKIKYHDLLKLIEGNQMQKAFPI